MNTRERVINELYNIMGEENQKPLCVLGGYIVGLLIANDNRKIADYASDLEINNGNAIDIWEQIKTLITGFPPVKNQGKNA